MKFLKLFESYKSQKEIEEISNRIIKLIAKETYDSTKPLWDLNENDPTLRGVFYNLITVKDVFSKISKEGISEMLDFMDNFKLSVKPQRWNIDDSKSISGSFRGNTVNDYPNSGIIQIKYDDDLIKEITKYRNEIIDQGQNFDDGLLYNKIFFSLYNVLIHELQHAYDFYRSDGKYTQDKKSIDYYNQRKDVDELEKMYDDGIKLTDQQIKKLNILSKKYLKLRHEIDARFTQAIRKVSFYDLDFIEDENGKLIVKHEMQPFKKVKKDFEWNFDNYRILSDKDKKRLLRKLGQFYQFAKDDISKEDEKLNK